jgi:hypothetical protein
MRKAKRALAWAFAALGAKILSDGWDGDENEAAAAGFLAAARDRLGRRRDGE